MKRRIFICALALIASLHSFGQTAESAWTIKDLGTETYFTGIGKSVVSIYFTDINLSIAPVYSDFAQVSRLETSDRSGYVRYDIVLDISDKGSKRHTFTLSKQGNPMSCDIAGIYNEGERRKYQVNMASKQCVLTADGDERHSVKGEAALDIISPDDGLMISSNPLVGGSVNQSVLDNGTYRYVFTFKVDPIASLTEEISDLELEQEALLSLSELTDEQKGRLLSLVDEIPAKASQLADMGNISLRYENSNSNSISIAEMTEYSCKRYIVIPLSSGDFRNYWMKAADEEDKHNFAQALELYETAYNSSDAPDNKNALCNEKIAAMRSCMEWTENIKVLKNYIGVLASKNYMSSSEQQELLNSFDELKSLYHRLLSLYPEDAVYRKQLSKVIENHEKYNICVIEGTVYDNRDNSKRLANVDIYGVISRFGKKPGKKDSYFLGITNSEGHFRVEIKRNLYNYLNFKVKGYDQYKAPIDGSLHQKMSVRLDH